MAGLAGVLAHPHANRRADRQPSRRQPFLCALPAVSRGHSIRCARPAGARGPHRHRAGGGAGVPPSEGVLRCGIPPGGPRPGRHLAMAERRQGIRLLRALLHHDGPDPGRDPRERARRGRAYPRRNGRDHAERRLPGVAPGVLHKAPHRSPVLLRQPGGSARRVSRGLEAHRPPAGERLQDAAANAVRRPADTRHHRP